MIKRLFYPLGLACMFLANPIFFIQVSGQDIPQPIMTTDSATMSLAELYALADEESRVIRLSQTALLAAEEELRQAKNAFLPHVNINVSGSYIGNATLMNRDFSTRGTSEVILPGLGPQQVDNGQQKGPHWGNTFSVEATQIIYGGGALRAGKVMAKLNKLNAELNVEKSRQDVRFLIASQYLDLVKLQNQSEVLNRHIALTENVIAQMKAKERVGITLHNDITRYELQLKQLQLAKKRIKDAMSIIQGQLMTALHISAHTVIVPDTAEVGREYGRLQRAEQEHAWQKKAEDNNISIRQAAVQEQISAQQVKAVRAASVPTIAAVAKDELFGPYTTDLIPVNANINAWFIGIGIRYDLGSIWHNRHAVKRAKTVQNAALEQKALVSEEISNAIHEAFIHFTTAFTEVDTQQKQVELADENYAIVEKRYNNDLALLTDLLDASSMKLQADMELVNAQVTLLYQYYRLKYATHTL